MAVIISFLVSIWYTTKNTRKMVPFCKRWKELRKLIELTIFVSNLNLLFHSCFFCQIPRFIAPWRKEKKYWNKSGGQYSTSGSIYLAFSLSKRSISAAIYAIHCSCSFELQQRNTSHPWPTAFPTKCGDTVIYLFKASVKRF